MGRNKGESKKMGQKFSEMSLGELWRLFPIILSEPKAYWKEWYIEEEAKLKEVLPADQVVRISHIGSTAIEGIWAKPIIDILAEVTKDSDLQSFKEYLTSAGYLCMSENSRRLSFNKGYTEKGFAEKVFHLHLRYYGDNDELYFRDYMNDHPALAAQYEKLKLSLWKKYEYDRDAYTDAKSAFVDKYTGCAKKAYASRYEADSGL